MCGHIFVFGFDEGSTLDILQLDWEDTHETKDCLPSWKIGQTVENYMYAYK